MDKATVDANKPDEDDSPAHRAEELMEAAAYSKEAEGRLWRLEWAQAFRKLAELGRDRNARD